MNGSWWQRLVWMAVIACAFAYGASAQGISNSKLSIHLINDYTPGSSNVVAGLPRLLKVLAVDPNFPSGQLQAIRDFKAKAPTGKVIVRVYSPKTYWTNDDPTLSAGDFWTNHMRPALNQLSASDKQLIDYLEGPNEGETPTLGYPNDTNLPPHFASQWFNQFWTNLTPMMVAAGFKPCIGSIAVGNPGDLSEFDSFVPALRQAKAAGGSWSYHAYTINYTTDVATEVWYSLRYRQFYSYFAANYPDLADMPLVLTEAGVDFNGTPATSGWQARGSAANYQRWLNWFDNQMQQDSYVIGCTLFQNGDASGWASFDLETVMAGAQPGVVPITGWMKNYLTNPTDFPTAPSAVGFSAAAIGNKVQLAWTNLPANPTTYNVKRSAASGGPYATIATAVTEGIQNTSYTDTAAPAGVPSYYVISAVTAFGESANSSEVSATPNLPKINCGGGTISPFSDDAYFSGGQTFSPTNTINTNGVVNPAPMAVYQSQRYGNLTYSIPNLAPNTSYKVRLHFAEVYFVFNSAGKRVFNVYLNDAKVLSNFDIWAAAGGQFKANVQEFNAVSDSSGKVSVRLETVVDNASINGIEIITNPANIIPTAPTNLTATANSGNITLNWFAPVGATRFNIKRSTISGGPYTTIASNVTAGAFLDTSYVTGTTYYYVVTAVNSLGESAASNQASAAPTNGLPDAIATALTWTNTTISPGNSVFFRTTVKNQGSTTIAANTLGIGILVDGAQIGYVGAGNTALGSGASATYTANGGPNGGAWIATAGAHTITAVVDDINRFAEGNENNNLFSVPLNVYVSSYKINSGGNASGTFNADSNVSGSTNTYSVANTIDLTAATNAAPQAIYQSERWGPIKYTFSNLIPGNIFKTRLHFAEISPSVTQIADRRFHVLINGTQVLTNFDIYAAAGAKFRATTRQFNSTADGLGNIVVHLARGAANEPKISGLEIFPYTNTAPVLASIANKTVNAGATLTFTNTATDGDIPADSLIFTLFNGPSGANVSTGGVFTWTAPNVLIAQTNSATVRVTDDGVPALNDSKAFSLITIPPPRVSSITATNGILNLTWQTYPTKTYRVQFKSDLNDLQWTDLGNDVAAAGYSMQTTNAVPNGQRYYRIVQID